MVIAFLVSQPTTEKNTHAAGISLIVKHSVLRNQKRFLHLNQAKSYTLALCGAVDLLMSAESPELMQWRCLDLESARPFDAPQKVTKKITTTPIQTLSTKYKLYSLVFPRTESMKTRKIKKYRKEIKQYRKNQNPKNLERPTATNRTSNRSHKN